MKKSKSVKRKSKRKLSRCICVRCDKVHLANRCDAKYDDECKKKESDERIAKGFIYKIVGPLKNGPDEFYNENEVRAKNPFVPNPFAREMKEYILTKNPEEMLRPWKHEFGNDFILYFFPQCSKKYDIFYSEKRKAAWNKYKFLFLQKNQFTKK